MNKEHRNGTEQLKRKIVWKAAVCFLIAIVIVGFALFDFRSRVYQREHESQIERMQGEVSQSSEVLEERLTGYLNTISSLAELFAQGELHTEKNVEKLDRIAAENEMDFYSLGITDAEGYAWVTNGKRVDVSEREFFQRALAGEKVISRSFDSKVTGADIFMVAVPIRDTEANIKGVLYGTVTVEDFPLFRNEKLQELSRYIHVIDSGGNYIFQGEAARRILEGDNFYDSMEGFSMEMSVEELQEKMLSGEELFLTFEDGTEEYILCTAFLPLGKWNMAFVMKASYIDIMVSYLLGNDIYWMILKCIVAFMVVCGIIMWYLQNDKKYIMKLYGRLRIQDRLIRKAVAAIDSVILFYDVNQDKLEILSDNQNRLQLPQVIFDASRRLTEYLPVDKEIGEELLCTMNRLREMEDIGSFELPLEIEGETKRFIVRVEQVVEEGRGIFHYVGMVEDVTEQNSLEQELKFQQKLFAGMAGFMVADLEQDKVIRSSENFHALYEPDATYSEAVKDIIDKRVLPEYRETLIEQVLRSELLRKFASGERRTKTEFSYWDAEGEMHWMECEIRIEPSRENRHCMAYITLQDISDKKKAEQILKEKADRDDLTGLYNRRSTVEMVDELLTTPGAEDMTNALVLLDLDNFKEVNDTLGHQAGDRALTEVAQILLHHFREYDIVSRLGGDEFVVFIKQIPKETISRNIEALMRHLKITYNEDGKTVTFSASAGIAVTPEHGMDFKTLYQKADEALYDVKKSGKRTYKIYSK